MKCNYLSHLFNGTTFRSDQWFVFVFVLGLRRFTDAIIHGAIQNQNPPNIIYAHNHGYVPIAACRINMFFFHHPLIDIIYVHNHGYVPIAACYINMFLAICWASDHLLVSDLTVDLFMCYWFFDVLYIHLSMVTMLDSDFVLREWRHFVLIRPVKIITQNTNTSTINKT